MARDENTYAKRQRETLKRQKAEAEKERREKRKEQGNDSGVGPNDSSHPWAEISADASDLVPATIPNGRPGAGP